MTLVLAKGLASLQNLIKQDVYTLNRTSIQRLERHVQKLANAAQISFAKRALFYDQNQMLTRINNEAKVRQSTRSIVLGKAKVMSFEDIEVARTARATKEVIKGKGKRGRKRKSAAIEADEPETEPEPEVARAAKGKRGRKRKSTAQEADEPEPEVALIIDAPVPWRAPVARMI
jgi:septum formation inhibitor MinC